MRAEIAGHRWETKTLDALRSVMMLMVFTGHYPIPAPETRSYMYVGGEVGVNGFQAISFATLVIAYYANTENQHSCQEYLLFFFKRCARLLPLYYACKLVQVHLWGECNLIEVEGAFGGVAGSARPEPFTSIGTVADWLNLGCWIGGATLPNVHLWFVSTLLWLNALLPYMVTREAKLLRFRPLGHTLLCSLAGGILIIGSYFLYSREVLPLLTGVDETPPARAWQTTRATPLVRVPSMLLTVKATLAVIRGDWTPSRSFIVLWLCLLLVTLFGSFSAVQGLLRYVLPPTVAVPHFSVIKNYLDGVSMHVFALLVPMLIFWENVGSSKEGGCGSYQWWLSTPPMKLLISVSRYSLSFYVWQMVAFRLVQYEQLESAPDFPCADGVLRMPVFAPHTGVRLYFSSLAHLFTLAVLSHHLIEEPSNTVLKRLLEGWLRSPSAKAKGLELA